MSALDILAKRGLDIELLEKLGIRPWAEPKGKLVDERRAQHGRDDDWIEIEYRSGGQLLRKKLRPLREPKKGYFFMTPGPKVSAWNRDVLDDESLADQPLVITEGELDAPAVIQCGWPRTISVPNGAPDDDEPEDSARYDWLEIERDRLRGVKEIILATDGDPAGMRLRDQLAMRLGRARCKWLQYPKACKDLGDTLRLYKQKGVETVLSRAQWMPVAGVCRWSQLPPTPQPPAWDLPLLRSVWRPRPGDFSVVTGIPGHGKSLLLNWAVVELARRHRVRPAIASFELGDGDARPIFRGLAHGASQMTEYQAREADAWLDEHLLLMIPPDGRDATLSWLWDCMEAAVLRHACRMVVLDPWNELDHLRKRDQTLTEYTGAAIKAFKQFAKRFGCHVVVTAHPAKMRDFDDAPSPPELYHISDSAHWFNKPDVGLTVWRDDKDVTTIFNRKAKHEGLVGTRGASVKLRWNAEQMRYETA